MLKLKFARCEVAGCNKIAVWRKKGFWLCVKHVRYEIVE
jgi:hypothetical protein